ncbi:unnamed protein product [Porites lobata]|uniref:FHA domain-containing protein n=1 Tax=Porites lobata TaxID=104759 RepID=A0ABN8N5K1_9CNID|nr:unnamed protein product [Porites lobata]
MWNSNRSRPSNKEAGPSLVTGELGIVSRNDRETVDKVARIFRVNDTKTRLRLNTTRPNPFGKNQPWGLDVCVTDDTVSQRHAITYVNSSKDFLPHRSVVVGFSHLSCGRKRSGATFVNADHELHNVSGIILSPYCELDLPDN